MRPLISLLGLLALACSTSHSTDCDAPLHCFQGWSGSRSCCLESTETLSCDACPTGYFAESACGRVDAICEGVDAGGFEDGGGGCGGPAPLCYPGWGGSPDCCLEPGSLASCRGAGWACPSGTFFADECGRLDAVCEGIDAGPGPGLHDDCTATSDCALTSTTCCGVCGMPSRDDVAAVNESRLDDYYLDVACPSARDEPPICPGCAGQPNPHLAATCDMRGVRPVCLVVDFATDAYAACDTDADCRLAAPECCACGAIDAFGTIAVRNDADLHSVLCDDGGACPPCVPVFDERAAARCDAGRCVVALSP